MCRWPVGWWVAAKRNSATERNRPSAVRRRSRAVGAASVRLTAAMLVRARSGLQPSNAAGERLGPLLPRSAVHTASLLVVAIQHSAAWPRIHSKAIPQPLSVAASIAAALTTPHMRDHFTPRGLRLVRQYLFKTSSRAQPCTRVARQRPQPACFASRPHPQQWCSEQCDIPASTRSDRRVRHQRTEPACPISAQRSSPSRLLACLDKRTPSVRSARLVCPRLQRPPRHSQHAAIVCPGDASPPPSPHRRPA